MKNAIHTLGVLLLFCVIANAQTAPDFTITDPSSGEHSLYEDYLDQGTTVVLKIFFVACPPCNTIAPSMQEKYVEWGEGAYDVQFIELSNKTWDSNEDVAGFKSQHGLTFPGAGFDGGGFDAQILYTNGTFGPFLGTPSYYVIAPDKTVTSVPNFASLDEAITATGATGMEEEMETETTNFSLSITNTISNETVDGLNITIGDSDDTAVDIDLSQYSSVEEILAAFPNLSTPKLFFNKTTDPLAGVSTIDITKMIRHILGLELLDTDEKVIAADVNDDGKVSAVDIVALRKVILEIEGFPNDNVWKFQPQSVNLITSPGNILFFDIDAIKIGDLTF